MVILDKVVTRQGIETDKVLETFSKESIEKIYPALSPEIMWPLMEELVLMDYLEVNEDKAFVTEKGKTKLEYFKRSLTPEERETLEL
jgi:hypothetical protein